MTTEQNRNTIRVIFADDGTGMSKESLARLFTPFFTTKKMGEGTGLGLSVCLGIITEHRGHILVNSTEGKGTTFIVELPAHSCQA